MGEDDEQPVVLRKALASMKRHEQLHTGKCRCSRWGKVMVRVKATRKTFEKARMKYLTMAPKQAA